MTRNATVIIDDFSTIAQFSPGVVFYDYGDFYYRTSVDYNGDGFFDDTFFEYTGLSGFDRPNRGPITISSGVVERNGFLVYEQIDIVGDFEVYSTPSGGGPLHGDWVLHAFDTALDFGNTPDRILIDVDEFNGGYSFQIPAVFDPALQLDGSTSSGLEYALNDFLFFAGPTVLSGVSMSLVGVDPDDAVVAELSFLNSLGIPFIQAAANVAQEMPEFGQGYPNTLTVGAYNVDPGGFGLFANFDSLGNLDILADGLVEHPFWGSTFGTSFATPRVAAALSNETAAALAILPPEVFFGGDLSDAEFGEIQDGVVDSLSTPVRLFLANGFEPVVPVYTPELFDGVYPRIVEGSFGLPDFQVVAAEVLNEFGFGLSETQARTVAYLYEAGLDRDGDIDVAGLNFWIDQREEGLSEVGLAEAFLFSAEFSSSYGNPDFLSDTDLVRTLYRNVLDREGEQAGIDFWTGLLFDGTVTRPEMLLEFSVSGENRAGSPYVEALVEVSPGIWAFDFSA